MWRWIALTGFALLVNGIIEAADTAPQAGAPAANTTVALQLRQMVSNAQSALGTLEPWQKTLFDEEVMAEPQRFVTGYHQSDSGVAGEVDVPSIRRFLRLYGPKLGTDPKPKILTYLKAEVGCDKCQQSAQSIGEMVKARLERRGFMLVPVTVEEVGDPKLAGKALDDRLADIAQAKAAVGSLTVLWQLAPLDDVDSAHADEKRYQVKVSLTVKNFGHNDDQLEILDSDSFERTAFRLLTNSMTDVGEKVEEALLRQEQDKQAEVLLAVKGFTDFAQYTKIKAWLSEKFKDVPLEELRIARGKAVFGIHTAMTREQIMKHVGAGSPAPGVQVEVQ
jgi:hypothetical protein